MTETTFNVGDIVVLRADEKDNRPQFTVSGYSGPDDMECIYWNPLSGDIKKFSVAKEALVLVSAKR